MASHRRLGRMLGCLASSLALILVSLPLSAIGGDLEADVRIEVGVISDPGSPERLSYIITNAGPSDAHHVIVRVPIPAPAAMRDVAVYEPCRITTPGIGHAGDVTIEFERLAPQEAFSVDVFVSLPEQAGAVGDVGAQVSADTTTS
jgi:hypothetical protein